MKGYKIILCMCCLFLLTACENKETGTTSTDIKITDEEVTKETETASTESQITDEEEVQETDTTINERAKEDAFDENALYDQFIEGNIKDADGNNCWYAKNDPYYDEFIDLEWAVYDLNGDGIDELIPRLYGGCTQVFHSCYNGKVTTYSNELFGSEGGFVNTKKQLVSTDCTHANRDQYIVSEFKGTEGVVIQLYFSKWWEDENNQDDATYMKYEGADFFDVARENYTTITKEEYEKLLSEYTQVNEEIVFESR